MAVSKTKPFVEKYILRLEKAGKRDEVSGQKIGLLSSKATSILTIAEPAVVNESRYAILCA